jgi:hypothetical protein
MDHVANVQWFETAEQRRARMYQIGDGPWAVWIGPNCGSLREVIPDSIDWLHSLEHCLRRGEFVRLVLQN